MKAFFFLLMSYGQLSVAQIAPSAPVRITLYAPSLKGQKVSLSTPDLFMLTPTRLATTAFDSSGTALLSVPLSQTTLFTDLEVGTKRYGLLVKPGTSLAVRFGEQTDSPVRFSGEGEQSARYLLGLSSTWKQFEARGGKHLMQLDPAGFRNRLDSVQKAYSEFTQSFTKRESIDKSSLALLEQKSALQLLTYRLNYAMAQYNPNDTTMKELPDLKSAVSEVPFDPRLLAANVYEYGWALSMYLQAGLYAPLVMGKSEAARAAIQQKFPLLADQQIIRNNYPATIRTFLRARNLYETLRGGITPILDSLLMAVRKEQGYSAYEPIISQSYSKWQALLPGRTAPNFSGITPKGDVLSLNSLKGKVVYVDVWATWCGPCREEFPDAKQLQKRFVDNNQVAFVYVSIDRDQAAWHKFLANDADFKGVHINQPPGEHFDSLWKAYQLSSIPRYMLIDQAGKLVDVNAARPSSGKIADEIERLLH